MGASHIYFRFTLWWRTAIKNVKIYLHTEFRQRSSICKEILLFPVSENKDCHIEYLLLVFILTLFTWWPIQLRASKSICTLNFESVAQYEADILLFPVSKNKRPPYWNSTSGFHFDGMWFCVRIPNFFQIGPSAAELWRHSDFQDGGRQPCWICFRVMVAHPRTASGGLWFVRKLRFDRIYSFGDSAIFVFWYFGLKLHIHADF